MGKIEQAKAVYEEIEIPKELNEMVKNTVEKSRIVHEHEAKKNGKGYAWKVSASVVAAAAVVCVAGLNTSSTFAAAASQVPVLGKVAEVLTFRNYDSADEDKTVNGEIPGVTIQGANVAETAFTDEVNAKIQESCDAYLEGAIKRVEEYKEAFISTGGTEEEFAEKNIVISVDYEIKSQTEDVLSFVVKGTESWVSAYAMTEFYNLNLDDLTYLTLSDVLGADYVQIANESIREQMAAKEAAEGSEIFWKEEDGGFATVDESTRFYIDGEGRPVVVFDKYEVAPGAYGMVEFTIGEPVEQTDTDAAASAKNEAVKTEAEQYQAFAEQIRDAVLAEDMEAMADLIAYPTYIGLEDAGIIETREDFMALDPAELFTEEMKTALGEADFGQLEKFNAGVTITEGLPGITFNTQADGSFGITGINY